MFIASKFCTTDLWMERSICSFIHSVSGEFIPEIGQKIIILKVLPCSRVRFLGGQTSRWCLAFMCVHCAGVYTRTQNKGSCKTPSGLHVWAAKKHIVVVLVQRLSRNRGTLPINDFRDLEVYFQCTMMYLTKIQQWHVTSRKVAWLHQWYSYCEMYRAESCYFFEYEK